MDLDNYINENLDEIVDNIVEDNENRNNEFILNEDDNINDFLDDMHEKIYENNNKKSDEELIDHDDGYYFINLINIFTKYYNNKFDKNENFLNNIKKDTETNNQMELFFECIFEYNMFKKKNKIEDNDALKYYFNYDEKNKIKMLFDNEERVYALEHNEKKLITPSLLICLNYIFENKIMNEKWEIYDLINK